MTTANEIPVQTPALDKAAFQGLLDFLAKLQEHKHQYRLACHREEAVMVELAVPGERWEIEFFAGGHVEVERFQSNGHMGDESELKELFTFFD